MDNNKESEDAIILEKNTEIENLKSKNDNS